MKKLLFSLVILFVNNVSAQPNTVNGWMLVATKNCSASTEIVEGTAWTGQYVQKFILNVTDPNKESYAEWLKVFPTFKKPKTIDYYNRLDYMEEGPQEGWPVFHEFYVGGNNAWCLLEGTP